MDFYTLTALALRVWVNSANILGSLYYIELRNIILHFETKILNIYWAIWYPESFDLLAIDNYKLFCRYSLLFGTSRSCIRTLSVSYFVLW